MEQARAAKPGTSLDAYLAQVSSDAFIDHCTSRLAQPRERIAELLETYANEARHGYDLIAPHLREGARVLEVGAGVGILAAYLHMQGHDIVAIEPAGVGFDLNAEIGRQVKQWLGLDDFDFVDARVEDLDAQALGVFELIYSVNVVEHLPDLDAAFAAMRSVLAPDGSMVHTCPNYHVPYEPHFGIPLVPGVPSVTRFVLPGRIATSGLWRSLNFVTSTGLRRTARRAGLSVEFESRTMYRSVMRLVDDPVFADRHRGVVAWVGQFLQRTGLIGLLRHWPGMLATPMVFTCRHRSPTT